MTIKVSLIVFLVLSIFACTHNASGLLRKEEDQENTSKFIELSSGKVTDIAPAAGVLSKNADGVTTSSLPFDSELYLKCADIFMQQHTAWNSTWQGYNCNNAVYFLSSEERLIYVNQGAIHSSNGNGAIIPTHPNGSLFTISTTSEGDSEDSIVIAVRFTNRHGGYMTLHIFEDERFVIDADYYISIYNKKSGKLVKKGRIENLVFEQ